MNFTMTEYDGYGLYTTFYEIDEWQYLRRVLSERLDAEVRIEFIHRDVNGMRFYRGFDDELDEAFSDASK